MILSRQESADFGEFDGECASVWLFSEEGVTVFVLKSFSHLGGHVLAQNIWVSIFTAEGDQLLFTH